jgi:hypothetical protein
MKKYSLIPIMLLFFSAGIFGQGIYNNGAKIVIGSGVSVTVSGTGGNFLNATNVTDGSIDLSGTLALAGNLTNNAVADVLNPAAIGGTVVLSGTASQALGGASTSGFTLPNLTVNNPAGIIISKNTIVNGTMTFTSGLVDIGNNNFTFGPTASVAGSPSATSMILAAGTGQVQKNWSTNGAFTYPVGNNTPATYSPVTLTFTGGTFAAGAFTGVNLVAAKFIDPTNSLTGSYLNRYWNVSQTGISAFVCNAVYQYQTIDVVGTEANISSLQVIPTPITAFAPANTSFHQLNTNGLTTFGTFTGGPGNYSLSASVFLEGPFNGSTAMNTTLNTGNLIPKTQPYTNVAPWNYTGTETVASIPSGVVDWVFVELRDAATAAAATSATIIAKRAGFLLSTGAIVDLDGVSPLNFGRPTIASNLYVVVRHRNHLAIMSAVSPTVNSTVYSYNFTSALTQAYGGGNGYKQVGTSFAMVGGDIDQDGNIFVSDYNLWATSGGSLLMYNKTDIDMDGNTFISDYNTWASNGGIINNALLKTVGIKKGYSSSVPK